MFADIFFHAAYSICVFAESTNYSELKNISCKLKTGTASKYRILGQAPDQKRIGIREK
jgi:hypothetical protein